MRIIGGKYRGRKIEFPKDGGTRPTKDRIRESVFNLVMGTIPGSCVLDLFSGSGAYGLEAISRGAEKIVFVDNSPESIKIIKNNVEDLKIDQKSVEVILGDSIKTIEQLSKSGEKFDIIISDPPYGRGMTRNILLAISKYAILSQSGNIIMEYNTEEQVPDSVGDICLLKKKVYKDISVSVYSQK